MVINQLAIWINQPFIDCDIPHFATRAEHHVKIGTNLGKPMKAGILVNRKHDAKPFLEFSIMQDGKIAFLEFLRSLVVIVYGKYVAQLPLLQAQFYVEAKEEMIVTQLDHIPRLTIELRGHPGHFLQLQFLGAKHLCPALIQFPQLLAQSGALIIQALLDEIVRAALQRGRCAFSRCSTVGRFRHG